MLQIGNLPTPAPPSGHGLSEFRHARCLADTNHNFTNRFDFLNGGTIVQSPFEVALELRVDLILVDQHRSCRHNPRQVGVYSLLALTSCGMRPATKTKLLSAAVNTLVLLRM